MSSYQEYINQVVPSEYLPPTLAEIKQWTWRDLATDRITHWTGPDGKKFVMARQLLHIWEGLDPQKISDLAEDKQQAAILHQQIAIAMIHDIFPSPTQIGPFLPPKKKKSISKTA